MPPHHNGSAVYIEHYFSSRHIQGSLLVYLKVLRATTTDFLSTSTPTTATIIKTPERTLQVLGLI